MKFKDFLILLLLSLYGSHSFAASSSLKNAQKKHTNNLFKKELLISQELISQGL